MKKHFFLWFAASALLMLLFPWFLVTFVRHDAVFMLCLLLFFYIDPLFSILLGWAAGKDIHRQWFLPILSAAMYVLGGWLFFEMGEPAFLTYGCIYLLLGAFTMLFSHIIHKSK